MAIAERELVESRYEDFFPQTVDPKTYKKIGDVIGRVIRASQYPDEVGRREIKNDTGAVIEVREYNKFAAAKRRAESVLRKHSTVGISKFQAAFGNFTESLQPKTTPFYTPGIAERVIEYDYLEDIENSIQSVRDPNAFNPAIEVRNLLRATGISKEQPNRLLVALNSNHR